MSESCSQTLQTLASLPGCFRVFQLFLLWNSWCEAETTKIHEQETTLSVQARSQMLDGSPGMLRTQMFRDLQNLQIKSTALKL